MKRIICKIFTGLTVALLTACTAKLPEEYTENGRRPRIYPDYTEVTVPSNIAPLHFLVKEAVDQCVTRLSWKGGEWTEEGRTVTPGVKQWRKILKAAKGSDITVDIYACKAGRWQHYKPFHIHVAEEEIDPWLSYRLICPSYVTYWELTINQRNLTDFDERILYGNMANTTVKKGQCINCHSYQNYNPDRMQFHVREGMGGTVIAYDGKLKKVNLKTDSLISGGVYPTWHPTEKLITYSVNKTGQTFHTLDLQKIEVQDMGSDLILYDVERNEVTRIPGNPDEMEVFPWWSPDGHYLYYASALFERRDTVAFDTEVIRRYQDFKYNLYRRPYLPQERTLGEPELVFDAAAIDKSATLPRISPDGRWLMFTLASYGVFHIWHKDADLWIMDLQTGETRPMAELNSDDVESYHSWSSNGRWVVFSSRRTDKNFTRPFIAYIDRNGKGRKPFELPQKDPYKHCEFTRSYNIPEFMKGPVTVTPQDFAALIRSKDAEPATQRN